MRQQDLVVLDPAPDRHGRPSLRRQPPEAQAQAEAPAGPDAAGGPRIVLLGNSKPNVEELFRGIQQGLRERSVTRIRVLDKGSPTIPMSAGALDEVLGACDLFVTAMAD
jgi:hypothetical protein